MKRNYYKGNLILIMLLVVIFSSCNYYRVTTRENITHVDIRWEKINEKYLILHSYDSAWHLSDIYIDSSFLSGQISTLPYNHKMYLKTDPDKSNMFKNRKNSRYEGDVLNEVHIYVKELDRKENNVSIPISAIQRMEIYEYAPEPSNSSKILSAFLVPIAVVGVMTLIVALTKSSCPYVYINDHGSFKFVGEIYSGAVYASLERDDYLPLPGFEPEDDKYTVKIANELPEVQYLNHIELWQIAHPANTNVLVDRYGEMHTMTSPEPPLSALSSGNKDLIELLRDKDLKHFQFQEYPEETKDTSANNAVILTFKLPSDQLNGKLVVRAKNSYWGDYVIGEFNKQFGNRYGKWVKKTGKEPPDKPLKWKLDQKLPLMVYVETRDGWQFVDYFDMAGPLAFRDMVMQIDFNESYSDPYDQVRIKIETAFMFWDLDYAAIDFSEDQPYEISRIKPTLATNQSGKDVKRLIEQDDKKYHIQPSIGDELILEFADHNPVTQNTISSFLHVRGYYEHVRNFKNQPDRRKLETFRVPGRLSEFSYKLFMKEKDRYDQWQSLRPVK